MTPLSVTVSWTVTLAHRVALCRELARKQTIKFSVICTEMVVEDIEVEKVSEGN